MLPMDIEYTLGIGDYRAAVYFGTAVRHRRALQIFAVVAAVAVLYTMGGTIGLWSIMMLPAYVGLAYGIWLAVLLGRTELGILRFVKKDDQLLGKTMRMSVTEERLTLEIPDRGSRFSVPVRELFLVFETSRFFNIYMDPHQTVLLPISALSAEQRAALRSLFGRKLKERFETRYGPKGERKKRGLFSRG